MLVTALIVLALNPSPSVPWQCPSIPNRIAARPESDRAKPLEMYPTYEMLIQPLEDVVAAADLVVEGTVRPLRAYLSPDRCTLFTDYAVTVSEVLYGAFPPQTEPGQPAPLLVTTEGGEATVDGVRVLVRLSQLPPFTPGQRVLLILSKKIEGGKVSYEIAKGLYGAFAIENGRVKHLLQSAGSARFEDMDKAALIAMFKRR